MGEREALYRVVRRRSISQEGGQFLPSRLRTDRFQPHYLDCSYQWSFNYVFGLRPAALSLADSIESLKLLVTHSVQHYVVTRRTTSYYSSLAYHHITARHT
jgi:hypothetical protein